MAAGLVAAPWYVACYLRNGDAFVHEFFWKHHFGRFLSSELQHVQPFWFYVPVFAGLLFPWTPALAALRGIDWREPRRRLLLAWLVFGFLFFSLSANKLPGYVLPLLPAAAALMGIRLAERESPWLSGFCAALLVVMPVAAAVLPEAVADGLSRASAGQISWLAVGLLAAAALGVFWLGKQSPAGSFTAAAALTSAAVVWTIASTFGELDRVASARPWWRQVSRHGTLPCIDDLHRSVRYGLFYYAGRQLPACSGTRERNHAILDRDTGVSR
jgi:4-amino-4-deoxy-L-arabinose transferase-like glycosyltransferase